MHERPDLPLVHLDVGVHAPGHQQPPVPRPLPEPQLRPHDLHHPRLCRLRSRLRRHPLPPRRRAHARPRQVIYNYKASCLSIRPLNLIRDELQKKHVIFSDIVTIAFDPLPP